MKTLFIICTCLFLCGCSDLDSPFPNTPSGRRDYVQSVFETDNIRDLHVNQSQAYYFIVIKDNKVWYVELGNGVLVYRKEPLFDLNVK